MSTQPDSLQPPLPMSTPPESAPSAGPNTSARGPKRLPHEGWMRVPLYVAEHHVFEHDGRKLLFNVGTVDFFEIDNVVESVLQTVEGKTLLQLFERLRSTYGEKDLYSAVRELREAEIVTEQHQTRPEAPVLPGRVEVSNLALQVTTDSLSGTGAGYLDARTGRKAIELLLQESGRVRSCGLTLVGEPLLNPQLTFSLIDAALDCAEQAGKQLRIAVVSDPRLVNERILSTLRRRGVDLVISDAAGELEGVYGSGPSSLQRSSLSSNPRTHLHIGATDRNHVEQIREALGENQNLVTIELPLSTAEHLRAVSDQDLEHLSAFVGQHVLSANATWIGPIEDAVVQVYNGRRTGYGDSAGITRLAVGCDGAIYVSEHGIGQPKFQMGHVEQGIDQTKRRQWIREAHVDARPGCQTCWARHLCGGGSTLAVGTRPNPDSDYCKVARKTYELAMGFCVNLYEGNPELLGQRYGQDVA